MGSEIGSVCYDARKIVMERPGLRGKDNKEIPLETYKSLQSTKGMSETVCSRTVLGISNRKYEEAIGGFLNGYGIKKSSVSCHFVKATAEQMREFMERDLSALDLCAIS